MRKTLQTMKNRLIIFGFLISLMMSGCIVYHPMTTDIPLISEKNDLRIDAGISIVPSANATVSYGLTDKIAIQGFGSIGADDRYYFQAATGLYKNKGDNKIFELYGGFGYGYGNAYKDANPGNLLGDYQLYFGQANFGKISSNSSNFETGFGIKAGYLHSNLTDKNYYDWTSETGPFKIYHDESILFEPVGFIRFGGHRLRMSVKLGGTLICKFTNTDKNLPYSYLNLGIGLNYRL
jgi:hypothetical protein